MMTIQDNKVGNMKFKNQPQMKDMLTNRFFILDDSTAQKFDT